MAYLGVKCCLSPFFVNDFVLLMLWYGHHQFIHLTVINGLTLRFVKSEMLLVTPFCRWGHSFGSDLILSVTYITCKCWPLSETNTCGWLNVFSEDLVYLWFNINYDGHFVFVMVLSVAYCVSVDDLVCSMTSHQKLKK